MSFLLPKIYSKRGYIERKPSTNPNLKDLVKKSPNQIFFDLGQELVPPAHLKAQ